MCPGRSAACSVPGQLGVASIARSIDSISERDSAPSLRRIRATWCSTVLAEMNSWVPMSRYGMPSRSSSATSRSRSDNRDDCGGRGPLGGGRGRRLDARSVVDGGREFEVAGKLQHRAGHPSVGGLQRGLAGQSGGVPGEPELGERPRGGGDLVDVDVVGQYPKPRPAGTRERLREGAVGAAAVRAWPCGATASGEFARIPAWTPAQCSGTDHNTGSPNDVSRANASSSVCCSRST